MDGLRLLYNVMYGGQRFAISGLACEWSTISAASCNAKLHSHFATFASNCGKSSQWWYAM